MQQCFDMEEQKDTITVVCGAAKVTLEWNNNFHLQKTLGYFEQQVIGYLLKKHGGIKSHVACELIMNRTTLVEKCKRYGFPIKK